MRTAKSANKAEPRMAFELVGLWAQNGYQMGNAYLRDQISHNAKAYLIAARKIVV